MAESPRQSQNGHWRLSLFREDVQDISSTRGTRRCGHSFCCQGSWAGSSRAWQVSNIGYVLYLEDEMKMSYEHRKRFWSPGDVVGTLSLLRLRGGSGRKAISWTHHEAENREQMTKQTADCKVFQKKNWKCALRGSSVFTFSILYD